MNDGIRKLMWLGSLSGVVLGIVIGATIVITFFTGHLDVALRVVERVYGTQESIPIAYDRVLRLFFLCVAVVMWGTAGIILIWCSGIARRRIMED